jgi:ElaB/YqjD/DUF883 family membrane-anchored ribosome-binding protein
MANTASETSREGIVGQGTSQVQDAASSAQEKAAELKEQGKSKLGETLDQRTNQAGEQARKVAQALRQSGEQLRNQDDGQQIAGVAQGAADRIERLGDYLSRASGDELLRDVEDFARRRPWMIAGIGLVAGLSASRFLKASSERRFEGSMQGSGYSSRYRYGTIPSSTGGPYPHEASTRQSYGTSGVSDGVQRH